MKYSVYGTMSRTGDDSFGIVTSLWAGWKRNWCLIAGRGNACTPGVKSLQHRIQ